MKKCKLIYNPVAGNQNFPKNLDIIIQKLQENNFLLDIYRTKKNNELDKVIRDMKNQNYHNIIIAGGDGSLNLLINYMVKYNINIPIGIIPTGTANDFATYINMPTDIMKIPDIINENNIEEIDLGKINNKYFINVCMVGKFSSVPQNTNTDFKSFLGKTAYYLNGLKEIPNIKPIPFKITTKNKIIEEKLYMFVILNSSGAGGFKNLSPTAKINDGLFDFIGIRYQNNRDIYKFPSLLMQVLQGEHLTNDEVLHLREKSYEIECLDLSLNNYNCDIDGEKGPELPLKISVLPKKISIYSNKKI